jgi:hypothetical protein
MQVVYLNHSDSIINNLILRSISMVKKILVGLILVGGFVAAANACYYYPELKYQAMWVNAGVTHYYDVFQYVSSPTGLDKNWTTAETYTTTKISGTGWTLAGITSAAEQAELTTFMKDSKLTGEYWIGGYQNPVNGGADANWHWVSGEAWGYTAWNPGEPNDYTGKASESYLGTWSNDGWQWNDEGNTGNISGFIAERTSPVSVPEPGTLSLLLMGGIFVIVAAMKKRKA